MLKSCSMFPRQPLSRPKNHLISCPNYPAGTSRVTPVHKKRLNLLHAQHFGQRRKMLRSSLKKINGDHLLKEAGIAPDLRPQDIDIEGFCKLAHLYESTAKTRLNSQRAMF